MLGNPLINLALQAAIVIGNQKVTASAKAQKTQTKEDAKAKPQTDAAAPALIEPQKEAEKNKVAPQTTVIPDSSRQELLDNIISWGKLALEPLSSVQEAAVQLIVNQMILTAVAHHVRGPEKKIVEVAREKLSLDAPVPNLTPLLAKMTNAISERIPLEQLAKVEREVAQIMIEANLTCHSPQAAEFEPEDADLLQRDSTHLIERHIGLVERCARNPHATEIEKKQMLRDLDGFTRKYGLRGKEEYVRALRSKAKSQFSDPKVIENLDRAIDGLDDNLTQLAQEVAAAAEIEVRQAEKFGILKEKFSKKRIRLRLHLINEKLTKGENISAREQCAIDKQASLGAAREAILEERAGACSAEQAENETKAVMAEMEANWGEDKLEEKILSHYEAYDRALVALAAAIDLFVATFVQSIILQAEQESLQRQHEADQERAEILNDEISRQTISHQIVQDAIRSQQVQSEILNADLRHEPIERQEVFMVTEFKPRELSLEKLEEFKDGIEDRRRWQETRRRDGDRHTLHRHRTNLKKGDEGDLLGPWGLTPRKRV